jgi:5'-methylthioadenosine phosphorylase
MRAGLISGSGSYTWPGLLEPQARTVATAYGDVDVTEGQVAGVEVVHLSRHGAGHARLSHQVRHLANLAALRECHVDVLVSMTVCGAVDPSLTPGSLVVFDDLYFPGNRLPDGTPCTWFDQPGAAGRGHWILDTPYSEQVRAALLSAEVPGTEVVDRGCYGQVDGPRFNTRTEIAALAAVGVSAVSQTAAPEVVLAGEAELPMALVGFVTDYANGVATTPEPVEALLERMAASTNAFATLVKGALPRLSEPTAPGTVYRFGP